MEENKAKKQQRVKTVNIKETEIKPEPQLKKITTKTITAKNVFAHNGRTYFECELGGVFIFGEHPKMTAIEYKDSFEQNNIIKIVE